MAFPMGVQFHALHHLLPGIPFHHLEEAHRRLTAALPAHSAYRRASERGILTSLRRLYGPERLPAVPPPVTGPG